MKSKMHLPWNKGSIVVEASLIFPIVFLAVVAAIYFGLIIYQKAYIQSIADSAAEKGAAVWDNPEKNMITGGIGKADINSGGLYWRLFDFNEDKKEEKVKEFIQTRVKKYSVLGLGAEPKIDAEIKNFMVYRVLNVSIDAEYIVPAGKILKMFGLSEKYRIYAVSSALVTEPAEFIRTTDFVMDTEKEIEKSHPGYQKVVSNVRANINNIKDKIDKFFKENGE